MEKVTREHINQAFLRQLGEMWEVEAPMMADYERDPANLQFLLAGDPERGIPAGTEWYIVSPATIFYVHSVRPGHNAMFGVLGSQGLEDHEGAKALKFIARDLGVRRITWSVPSSVVDLVGVGTRMGFTVEGTMKDGTIYNGEFTDLNVLGFLLEEKPKKRRRRRRRKKRNGTKTAATE